MNQSLHSDYSTPYTCIDLVAYLTVKLQGSYGQSGGQVAVVVGDSVWLGVPVLLQLLIDLAPSSPHSVLKALAPSSSHSALKYEGKTS